VPFEAVLAELEGADGGAEEVGLLFDVAATLGGGGGGGTDFCVREPKE